MTDTFVPSKYQEAIFTWVKDGQGNAFVDAAAGSGKSTTLVQASALIPKRTKALFCAFNRHISRELTHKLNQVGSTMECRTIHGLGRGALVAALKRSRAAVQDVGEPDSKKYFNLCEQYLNTCGLSPFEHDIYQLKGHLKKLVDFSRLTLTPATDEGLRYLVEHYDLDIEVSDDEWEILCKGVQQVIESGAQLYQKLAKIDFTDMIFLPIHLGLPPKKYNFLFVDEAQDLNACQLELVLMARSQGARLLFCGDPRQSLYGFAGADTESTQKIIERCEATVLPLSICYRCPSSHIGIAQQIYRGIEASPMAAPGIIQVIPAEIINQSAQAGDYIICRCTAPLVTRCMALIRSGMQATVLGKDLGKNFLDLLEKLEKKEGFRFEFLTGYADEYQMDQERILGESEENALQIALLRDKVATLKALRQAYLSEGGSSQKGNLKDFKIYIEHFFKPEEDEDGRRIDYKSFVVLCTVHKAKGLEAKRIFIDRPDLLPHPAAKGGWQTEQEQNILYVALTRSKAELYFIDGAPSSIQLLKEALPEDAGQVSHEPVAAIEDIIDYLRGTGWKRLTEPDADLLVFGHRKDAGDLMLSLPASFDSPNAFTRIATVIKDLAEVEHISTSQVFEQIFAYRDGSISCVCGHSLRSLHEIFGYSLNGHITNCEDCGGNRTSHVGNGWRQCLACGSYTSTENRVSVEPASDVEEVETPVELEPSEETPHEEVAPVELQKVRQAKASTKTEETKKAGRPKKGKGRTRKNCSFDVDVAAFLETLSDFSNYLEEFVKTDPAYAEFLQSKGDDGEGSEELEEEPEEKDAMVQVGVEVVTLSCPTCGKGVDAPDGTLLFSAEDWQRLPQLIDCTACKSPIKLPSRSPFRKASKKKAKA
ncbi:MAG: ATP-dependent helicase [Ktedonobacteraceae bacterium]|nr:ATP-dependent helicase [Ktedonobacteraceae bacterium]